MTRIYFATNQGTYGSVEACRKVGCGSAEFADCSIFIGPDGELHIDGCDPRRAPGYWRVNKGVRLTALQRRQARAWGIV